jgi:acetolactate synthase-1/2/3 large subunit
VLILADSDVTANQDMTVTFRTPKNFRHVTKWADTIRSPERIAPMFRRAFNEMRTGRPAPILLELPRDVMAAEVSETGQGYIAAKAGKFLPPQSDIASAVDALLNAKRPVIWSGQGVLMGAASERLTEFAELASIPVMTTMPGKSGFDETHPLSLGATNLTYSGQARKWLDDSDVVFAIGTSMSGTHYGQRPPAGKTMIHCSADPADINRDYDIDIPLPGDAKLVLDAMIENAGSKVSEPGHGRRAQVEQEIGEVRGPWIDSWMPILTSDEVPINPYRVIWEMEKTLDHDTTIVTHDAGRPRDQMMPFYSGTVPHSYIGWARRHTWATGWA